MSGFLKINLSALQENYRSFCAMTKAQVAGVLKADAYGLGVEPVFKALRKEGCKIFFVATPEEAFALRALDHDVQISVLGGLWPGAEEDYFAHDVRPVLNSLEMIRRWQAFARKKEQALPATVHFDTGMNRLGLSADETQSLLEDQTCLDGLDLQYVMSHFACADDKDHPMTAQQYERFEKIAAVFPNVKKSLANSPGLFRSKEYHYDLVRPGYALYGGNPAPETNNPVKPVVHLEVPALQVRNVQKGETIGYGASHVFEQNTQSATIALGYADGFLRSGSNKASVFFKGQACPVLGRVSMDLVTIGIGHLREKPEPGDRIEILGDHQGVDDLAQACGTIGYEILTSLGRRYQRVYQS